LSGFTEACARVQEPCNEVRSLRSVLTASRAPP